MAVFQSLARRLWAVRQKLFPSFEPKAYHLQFRHATLITILLMCAFFTLPANPQTKPFADSWYLDSPDIPVEASYNMIYKYVNGIQYYNVAIAAFIAFHLVVEPQFKRGAPVWFELFWMAGFVIGEAVCLGLMASSRPPVCDFHFGIDPTPPVNNKFSAKNSATSICSNWHGMNGLLAAIVGVFLAHMLWHLVVSLRHIKQRRTVFALPITDYRWTLPRERARINETFPADLESAPSESEKHAEAKSSFDYSPTTQPHGSTTAGTDTLSFPVTATSADEYSNYGPRPANLAALPIKKSNPLVVSSETHSDRSSIARTSDAGPPFGEYAKAL